jgi:diamine N-acetyltransferase
MKRIVSPFGNDTVCLRLIEERDLKNTLSWRNRDENRVWFKTSNPLTLEQHIEWFHRYMTRDDDFLFIVEVEKILVGQVSVYGIDWEAHCAEVGRFLSSPENTGKGYIRQALVELIRYCTNTFGLRYLFLEVFENNSRAIRLYQLNGFSEERRYDGLIRMSRLLSMRS